MPLRFYAEYAEAVFVVVEGDSLDQAGDFLRHGPAFGDCSIHAWVFILPWTVCACVTTQKADSRAIWLPGGIRIRWASPRR